MRQWCCRWICCFKWPFSRSSQWCQLFIREDTNAALDQTCKWDLPIIMHNVGSTKWAVTFPILDIKGHSSHTPSSLALEWSFFTCMLLSSINFDSQPNRLLFASLNPCLRLCGLRTCPLKASSRTGLEMLWIVAFYLGQRREASDVGCLLDSYLACGKCSIFNDLYMQFFFVFGGMFV